MDYVQMLADLGRNGDTMLAHISPEEAQLLSDNGGAGTVNPDTGLLEFYDESEMAAGPAGPSAGAGTANMGVGKEGTGASSDPYSGVGGILGAAQRNSSPDFAAVLGQLFNGPNTFQGLSQTAGATGLTANIANQGLNFATGGVTGLVSTAANALGIGMNALGATPTGPSGMYPQGNPATAEQEQQARADATKGLGTSNAEGSSPASVPAAQASVIAPSTVTASPLQSLASSLGINVGILDELLRTGVTQF